VAGERDAQSIETPKLHAALLDPRSDRPPPGAGTAATASARKPAGAPARPADRPRSWAIPIALGGAAIALGGAAVGTELWSASAYDRAQREPDDARQDALWRSANTRRYVAEGLGVASVACAGVAVWWYLRGEREPAAAPGAALGLAPLVGSDRAGLVLTGRY
ncbi:MAG TPA: hypothetical protein VK607_07915, partial [Kofleriaceae bacterium]|nr:hypothetical protein [Kofleriaceae bacterium]